MEGLLSRIRLDLIERELQGAIKLEEDSDRSLSQKVERRCNTQEIVLQLSEVSVLTKDFQRASEKWAAKIP